MPSKLFIRNMVCNRCRMVVRKELENLGLHPLAVELGEVELEEDHLDKDRSAQLNEVLRSLGFELIDDKRSRIIEKIKNLVIDLVHYTDEPRKTKHSEYLASHLHYDYPYLSRLFSEVEGMTIEQYIINQKIERAKELLVYDELSISELAYKLDYSSVAHLSAQFRKITGMTPSQFKALHKKNRKPLDEVGK